LGVCKAVMNKQTQILAFLVFSLTACPGGGIFHYVGRHEENFTSFDELLQFTNDFCEKYDGSKRFVYFNMDNEEDVTKKYYTVSMIAKKYDTVFYKDIVPEYWYGFDCQFCFVFEDNDGSEHQIILKQQSDFDWDVDQNDIRFEMLRTEEFDPSNAEPSEYFFDRFNIDQETGSFVKKYNYINYCSMYCVEKLMFDVYISSVSKPSKETLDEIYQVLMDNLVIYNLGE